MEGLLKEGNEKIKCKTMCIVVKRQDLKRHLPYYDLNLLHKKKKRDVEGLLKKGNEKIKCKTMYIMVRRQDLKRHLPHNKRESNSL